VRDIEGFYFATYRRWRGSKSDGFEDEADWEVTVVTNAGVLYQWQQRDGEGGLGGGLA